MARHNSVLVSRSLYQVGMITLVAAIMWVAVGVYLTLTKTVTVEVDKTIIEPLVTKLDMDIVDQLANRIQVEAKLVEIIEEASVGSESATLESSGDVTIEEANENEFIN